MHYDIFTVSKPANPLAVLLYPLIRFEQLKFARQSLRAVAAAMGAEDEEAPRGPGAWLRRRLLPGGGGGASTAANAGAQGAAPAAKAALPAAIAAGVAGSLQGAGGSQRPRRRFPPSMRDPTL